MDATRRRFDREEPDIVPPVADAGPDQPVIAYELVTFDGSGSSDDVGIVSWVWTFMWDGYPVELEGEIVTFVFDDTNVDVTVTLTVTDSGDNADTNEMIVHVGEWIPEMPMVALPVIGTLVIFGVYADSQEATDTLDIPALMDVPRDCQSRLVSPSN